MKPVTTKLSLLLLAGIFAAQPAYSDTPSNEELFEIVKEAQEKLAAHEQEMSELKQQLADAQKQLKSAATANDYSRGDSDDKGAAVGTNAAYSFAVLDHAENTNTKQRLQLRARRDGDLNSKLTLGGQITALANVQDANEDTRFGWLMRHPTSANQIGTSASEAVIHSANVNVTANLTDSMTGYVEMFYNPEQNFASGSTITGLGRNNVNVRRAWVMWGDLEKSPVYFSIGKMDIPFGWNDTVSPFTNSTNWHSFAGLAYGGMVGYAADNFHLRAMAVQGGAQFRNANTPVGDTAVPSKLNNFAVDANFDIAMANDGNLNLGVSYQHGTAYCQPYNDDPSTHIIPGPGAPPINSVPQGVQHFNPCDDNNPAVAVYGIFTNEDLMLAAEYGQTLDEWPGTFNPYIPQFAAEKNTTFTVGGRYAFDIGRANKMDVSLEFSRFEAGAEGSPWEAQDQLVLGASYYTSPSVNLFAEFIRVDGWVPLNFLSGGNPGSVVGTSWSSQSSQNNILTFGVQAGF